MGKLIEDASLGELLEAAMRKAEKAGLLVDSHTKGAEEVLPLNKRPNENKTMEWYIDNASYIQITIRK